MRLFVGGRQTGKTTELVKYANENNCIIIVSHNALNSL